MLTLGENRKMLPQLQTNHRGLPIKRYQEVLGCVENNSSIKKIKVNGSLQYRHTENKAAECTVNTDHQAAPLTGERRTSGSHSGLIATCGSVTREGLLVPPLCSGTQDNEAL